MTTLLLAPLLKIIKRKRTNYSWCLTEDWRFRASPPPTSAPSLQKTPSINPALIGLNFRKDHLCLNLSV